MLSGYTGDPQTDAAMPDAALPDAAPVADQRVFNLLVGITVVTSLYLAQAVLIPIVLAVLLTFILAPLVNLLRGLHLPRVVAVLLAVALALGVIAGLGTVIGSQVASLATGLPRYAQTVEAKFERVQSLTVGRLSQLASTVGRQSSGVAPAPAPASAAPAAPAATPFALAEQYLSPVLSPIATLGIVLIVAIFMLLQLEDLRDRLIWLFGAGDLHRTTGAMDDAGRRLSRYLLSQLAVNTGFGVVCGAGLAVIGVPNPVLWGLLSAIVRFVPYVGTFIAAGLPMALAAAVDPGWSMVAYTAGLYFVTEMVVSQAIEPLLYGRSTGLSPFAVVVSAILWSGLWGPIGLVLSMPLTLCLVVAGRYSQRLAFLEIMLGDRPALTAVESFYQRVLAGDADEVLDHAEAVLKTAPLQTYYDDVALPALKLAAKDAERGVLRPAQLGRIRRTIGQVIDDLASHAGPSASGRAGLVLCVAGRGPLDGAASAMLSQLLQQRGQPARAVSHTAVGRETTGSLDVTGVTAICISFLEIGGSPPHLRYLVRRLQARAPGIPILVGLWPTDDAVLTDPQIRTLIGADQYTTTLAGTVTACLALPAQAAAAPVHAPAG